MPFLGPTGSPSPLCVGGHLPPVAWSQAYRSESHICFFCTSSREKAVTSILRVRKWLRAVQGHSRDDQSQGLTQFSYSQTGVFTRASESFQAAGHSWSPRKGPAVNSTQSIGASGRHRNLRVCGHPDHRLPCSWTSALWGEAPHHEPEGQEKGTDVQGPS